MVLPSGTIIVKKVNDNNDFIEDALAADDIPISTTGYQYTSINVSGTHIQSVVDSVCEIISDGTRQNYKLVKSLEDFPAPVENVIILSGSYIYDVTGIIDLGQNRLEIGGDGTIIMGLCKKTDGLVYNGAGDMITALGKSFAITSLNIDSPAQGSRVFNVTNQYTNNLCIDDVYFGVASGCNSLGTISGNNLLHFLNSVAVTSSGLELNQPVHSLIRGNEAKLTQSGAVFLDVISGTGYDALLITNNIFEIEQNQIALKIPDLTVSGGGLIANNVFSPVGADESGLPISDHNLLKNIYWKSVGNYRLHNDMYIGYLTFAENNTPTTVTGTASYHKALGNNVTTELHRFSTDGVNNRLKFIGLTLKDLFILVTGAVASDGTNQTLRIAIYKYTAATQTTSFVGETEARTSTANQAVSFALNAVTELSTDDYLEVHVRNTTSTSNIYVEFLQFRVTGT